MGILNEALSRIAARFGFTFPEKTRDEQSGVSFVPRPDDDGALTVSASGFYGVSVDIEGSVRTEAELITRYRTMSQQPEMDMAIDEVVNEVVAVDEQDVVKILLDDVPVPAAVKRALEAEFDAVLDLLDFNNRAYDVVRAFYVDGRLKFHALTEVGNERGGIVELRYVDPRKLRRIKEVQRERLPGQSGPSTEAAVTKVVDDYYVYSDKGFADASRPGGGSSTISGLRIARESIIQVNSGLMDPAGTVVLSYLHKAIKPLNELRTEEDALVIYRLVRAPERRVWYIDVGDLPKQKAEQYVRDTMTRHKNRLVYDATTGSVVDDRKFMTMLEDYWLPVRTGGLGTKVTTLAGGANLGQMDDVLYFQKKLFRALNVPISRLDPENGFSLGRASEISREELKFAKFIARLRSRFATLFLEIIERNVVLKGVMTYDEWAAIRRRVRFDFAHDSYFQELKESEVLVNRAQTLDELMPYVGRYYSNEWVRRHVLKQSDDDMDEIDQEIAEESTNPQYMPPVEPGMEPGQGQPAVTGMIEPPPVPPPPAQAAVPPEPPPEAAQPGSFKGKKPPPGRK